MTCHPWAWGFLGTLLCPCKQAQASLQAGERCVVQAPPCPSWQPVNSQAWEWGHPRIASLGPSYHPQWASPAEISPDWPRSSEPSWAIDSWAVEEAYWFKPLDFAVVKKKKWYKWPTRPFMIHNFLYFSDFNLYYFLEVLFTMSPATVISQLFLDDNHSAPASEPLCLLFPLPRILFSPYPHGSFLHLSQDLLELHLGKGDIQNVF